jgi:hypothetical protein
MLRRVDHVRADVSEESSASIISVTRICEIGTALAVSSNQAGLEEKLCNIPEVEILHSHRLYNLESYKFVSVLVSGTA